MKRDVKAYFHTRNYPFVTVQVPEQDITDGRLKMNLVHSKLDRVTVSGNRYFSSDYFQKAVRIRKGEMINEKVVLNDLNFMNRNPFHQVNLVYAPGGSSNTTNLDLLVTDRFPFSAYAGVDNTGLQHIERTRIFGGVTWGNVFGLDQVLTVQYSMAPDIHKFYAITVSYFIELPFHHILNLYGGYSQVHAEVPTSSKTEGTSSQASLRYTVPLPATLHILQDCFAGFDFKRYNNTIQFVEIAPRIGQNVNLTQFSAGYNFGFETGNHKLGFDLQFFTSPFEWIAEQSNKVFESLNPHAKHTYVYGRAAVNYKVLLPQTWIWTFYASGQLTQATLLPSEQMGLGGSTTVRGYEERQLNGDDGILLKTELFCPKLKWGQRHQLQFLGFVDYGFAHDRTASTLEKKNDYLLGVGPGIRYSIERYLLVRLDWGIKLHHNDFPGGWSMLHFGATGSF
jgi:hemolysin activation/secretion protein